MNIVVAYKALIIIIIVIILLSLTSALHFLMKDKNQSEKMLASLTIRIALSVFLFLLIIYGYLMGWLVPNHI